MNNEEEISAQNRINKATELPQRVTELKLQCIIAPDIFQCDRPSPGPLIASCTQHSRRPKVTCHQECSAQSEICCPLRSSTSGPHQNKPRISNNPTGKSRMRLDPWTMDMGNVVYRTKCVVHEKGGHIEGSSHALVEEVILLNKELWCTVISSL
ncbi:hypothetical protein AVEN_19998-1 [Araneus ventricosus]|uniref:Uncharacterized protein n=1 Tax=Araneus ventricosus TaxID=182803 RepID=A0A4Y2PSU2_ARAVE|nr:hypothetical protein AVEN_19998-1 [Araneus ventricosus]